MAPTTTLVPPRRLGALLRQARVEKGWELVDLISRAGLTVVELDDVEHGRRDLDEATLNALLASYGIDDAELVPTRSQLVIDLDEGRIAVHRTDIDVDASFGPDAVLTRYLALVYRLRGVELGTSLPLRDVDLDVLSTSLSLESHDIESRLQRLMSGRTDVERDQHRIRRQLLLPLAGVVIAATGLGTLVLVTDDSGTSAVPAAEAVDVGTERIATPAIQEASVVETDIGNGGALEINPGN